MKKDLKNKDKIKRRKFIKYLRHKNFNALCTGPSELGS